MKSVRDNKITLAIFDYDPLTHLEIGKKYDLFDFDNAAKITNSKFVILKNQAAILEMAIINWAISKLIKKGFTFIITPDLCKTNLLQGCGFIPRDIKACK
jgi:seryl-tRNA synthetase